MSECSHRIGGKSRTESFLSEVGARRKAGPVRFALVLNSSRRSERSQQQEKHSEEKMFGSEWGQAARPDRRDAPISPSECCEVKPLSQFYELSIEMASPSFL